MASAQNQELIDRFEEFYRSYYRDAIGELAQRYPNEERSLLIDWGDLYRFDQDLADDLRNQPSQLLQYAEEALRRYDLPADVSLGQAHLRISNLPETVSIRKIRARHVNTLVEVRGIIRKATDVRPKIQSAAFECQRCGTLTRIPQSSGAFQEPHECQGCERQGPFRINFDQSDFIDAQKLRIQESPEGLRGGETPQSIDVHIEDDITGRVTAGDHVKATGILHLEQQGSEREKSTMFDIFMEGVALEVEDEQFEEMDITDEDKQAIVELSNESEIYDKMVKSIAPTIYGHDRAKLAMALQLFSGVTKHLPDGSRTRGDLHMLLIGDPGTGKCVDGDTLVTLSDGSRVPIRDIVERSLADPIPVDDGVYQDVDFTVPSLQQDGSVDHQRVTRVWKREAPDHLYRIRTGSGKRIDVTPSHPLFTPSNGRFKPVKAEDLTAGDFIATPRRITAVGEGSLSVDYRRSKSNNAIRLELPEHWTSSLARLIGYIIAEGHVVYREDYTADVRITNNDLEIREDVKQAYDKLGLNYTEHDPRPGKKARTVRCNAGEFVSFLERLEPTILDRSANRRVPLAIMRAGLETKAEFLKAYVDSEGTVSPKQREITVSSMSEELLEGVRSLLSEFGIGSQLHERQNGSFRLRISGSNVDRYLENIGFVTDREETVALSKIRDSRNTNIDILPSVREILKELRVSLALSQFECGIPRTTYQHYERGDRHPSRDSLQEVIQAFESRRDELLKISKQVEQGTWSLIEELRKDLRISPQELSEGMDVTQTAISYYERKRVAPDGSGVVDAKSAVLERIDDAISVAPDIERLRALVYGDVSWDRIEQIERVEPDEEWVYDLEVEGTHNYISNDIFSHNSQLLQYIRHIAPRSVYTSGKGSSAAGLCVTGDTRIHTTNGFERIRDIAVSKLPEPVTEETAEEDEIGVYTFDRETGQSRISESSHVWRMPEKPCRRIETDRGKELEASRKTPVLTCDERGIEWKPIDEVGPGDYVAVPRYVDVKRTSPSTMEYFEFTNEKLKLDDASLELIRRRLLDRFGTLRKAAAELDPSEDVISSNLRNRYIPLNTLETILEATDTNWEELTVERAMLRHGDDLRIPHAFDQDLMYLIGLVFGDGDIGVSPQGKNRGIVRISNDDEDLLHRAKGIIESVFDKRIEVEYQEDRVPSIRLHSATVARFFWNVGMRTPKRELALDDLLTTAEHADAFLRGFMDADGAVSVRTNGDSGVLVSTISEELGQQIQLMLETYGIRARRREWDRQGTCRLENGHEIQSQHARYYVELFGADVDRFAEAIGFESAEKRAALARIVNNVRRQGEHVPLAAALATVDGPSGRFWNNINGGMNPSRNRTRTILDEMTLGTVEPNVREVVDADIAWEEVVAAVDTDEKEVFDLTVPGTHNFVGNGIITHNTAAAVRDDFGDGNQWTLEAGAMVLADQGIAAIDELDKMRCVTGETVVELGDGSDATISSLADDASRAESTTIEDLANGRTIRGRIGSVRTMDGDGRIVNRPIMAIHEYQAPAYLVKVSLENEESIVTTPDHPYIVADREGRHEKPASRICQGDRVVVPRQSYLETDGGTITRPHTEPTSENRFNGSKTDVTDSAVRTVEVVKGDPWTHVYDLTVEGTHNFIANGMVVHNSEDRSALHEALEQQSYHPQTEVLLADGRRVEIGRFVDEAMAERPGDVIDGIDCEIFPVDDVKVHSVDLETNRVEKTPVDRVSRHEAPDEFVRVTFSNGRTVVVTPEHPMFVEDGGAIGTVEAKDLEEGTLVPAPRKLPNSTATVALADERRVGKEKDVRLPSGMSPELAEILGLLTAEGHSYAGSAHGIGFSNQDERLLARIDDLMADVFGMRSSDTTNAAGTITKRWISTKLCRWFEAAFPEFMHTARDKRIPAKVLGASEEEIRRFLVGAFAGDGGVESEPMAFSTASRGMADDYADALLKIGVRSRIQYDGAEDSWKTYVMGDSFEIFVKQVIEPVDRRYEKARTFVDRGKRTKRHHDVLGTSAAREIRELRRLLGLSLTGEFRPHLDEGYGVRIETVQQHLQDLRRRSNEIYHRLEEATTLSEIRSLIGWSGRELAERLENIPMWRIHYAEKGGYDDETRHRLSERARSAILAALDEFERRADELEARTDLRFYRVKDVEMVPNAGEYETEWVYDVTVEPTNTFVSQGVILHNSISISKAGINATLKSRCSLLGAANPKYGRFDQYESIGEQIDLEPALISRFDLIFTMSDLPDPEDDRRLAEHILRTNYAGELNTQLEKFNATDITQEEIDAVSEQVAPAIDPDLLRKYVAYAKQNCYPRMSKGAMEAIQEFYVDLRSKGADEDAPVPVTARKLEALVRLSEASARVRLADTVTREDAERVIEIVRACLQDIGVDPETGEYDVDVIETGRSKTQRDRMKGLKGIIRELQDEHEDGAPVDEVLEQAEAAGIERSKAEHEIQKLRDKGEIYSPNQDHLRVV